MTIMQAMRGGLPSAFQIEQATVLSNLAIRRSTAGSTDDAIEAARDAITLLEALRPQVKIDGDVGHVLESLGSTYGRSGDHQNVGFGPYESQYRRGALDGGLQSDAPVRDGDYLVSLSPIDQAAGAAWGLGIPLSS